MASEVFLCIRSSEDLVFRSRPRVLSRQRQSPIDKHDVSRNPHRHGSDDHYHHPRAPDRATWSMQRLAYHRSGGAKRPTVTLGGDVFRHCMRAFVQLGSL